MLLFGLLVNTAIAWLIAWNTLVWDNPATTEAFFVDDDVWTLTRSRNVGSLYIDSHHRRGVPWSPAQACGKPNAPPGTDSQLAWASATQDAQREWLELEYDAAVPAKSVEIHETYHPGAVDKITAYRPDGQAVVVWQGTDPAERSTSAAISTIALNLNFPTRRVRLDLDSPAVANWNEIDAVALVDAAGNKSWARRAKASSFYGQDRSTAGASPTAKLPDLGSLAFLARPSEQFLAAPTGEDRRIILAYGWPFLSLWREDPTARLVTFASVFVSGGRIGSGVGSTTAQALPVHIMLPGTLGNTAIYALLGSGLWWLVTRPRQFIREMSRMRNGCCVKCGYQLGYDFKAGCPECGWRRGDDFPPVG